MAGEARSHKKTKATPTLTNTPRGWFATREVWDRASRAELDIERAGGQPDPDAIWQRIKEHAPEEYRFEDKMPEDIKAILAHPGYGQLLELRKRMLVIPALKELGVFQELAGQMSYLAMTAAMEKLLACPDGIEMKELRQLAKTFLDVSLHLKGLAGVDEEKTDAGSLADIAAEEAREKELALSAIPEPYRELMGKKWDEERIKSLRTRQAMHTAETNKQIGHGKAV